MYVQGTLETEGIAFGISAHVTFWRQRIEMAMCVQERISKYGKHLPGSTSLTLTVSNYIFKWLWLLSVQHPRPADPPVDEADHAPGVANTQYTLHYSSILQSHSDYKSTIAGPSTLSVCIKAGFEQLNWMRQHLSSDENDNDGKQYYAFVMPILVLHINGVLAYDEADVHYWQQRMLFFTSQKNLHA